MLGRIPILLASAVASFGVAGTAQACVFTYTEPLEIEYAPPERMTDPAAIARWKAEREAFAEAYALVEQEREIREKRRELAAYADATGVMAEEVLAESLAANLTPPLQAAFAMYDSCGGISGPPVLDPAGYHEVGGIEAYAIRRGILDDPEDAKYIPRRTIRTLARRSKVDPYTDCLFEARAAVARALLRRFSRDELAHGLAVIRRNGFDRIAADNATSAYRRTGDYRLLAFVEGRSGPLAVSDRARPNEWGWDRKSYWELAPEQTRELRAFLQADPLGIAMVEQVESIVAQGTDVCPQSMAEEDAYWDEVRRLTYERKAEVMERRQRRTQPTSSQASPES